jgi:hypothetical protein
MPLSQDPDEAHIPSKELSTATWRRDLGGALGYLGTLLAAASFPLVVHAQADKATISALEGYFDFADANSGTIIAEQLGPEEYKKLQVLDVRDAGQFATDQIPGAMNIEWRQVFGHPHMHITQLL